MDLIDGLQQLGLTQYEAQVYAALVRQPSITGYEASRLSGVPRAKVYETLNPCTRQYGQLRLTARLLRFLIRN